MKIPLLNLHSLNPQWSRLEAAACITLGLSDVERHFDERTLTEAAREHRHGVSLRQLIDCGAREGGYHDHSYVDLHEKLRAAFTPFSSFNQIQGSGFSTTNLSGLMGNIATRFLTEAFNAVEGGWREIAAIRPATDFKEMTVYALTGSMEYERVGPAGEIKHGTLGETGYSNQVETFAKMFTITRQMIVNDDLGALAQIPRKLGRGAALALNRVFWTEFLDNASFFSVGNANYISGAGSALSFAGLGAATTKFRKQTDPDGQPLGSTPKILLVPPELEVPAAELMTSTQVNTGGASTEAQVANRNIWAGKYRVVSSSYLSNDDFSGYSTTAWYLLADPRDLAAIEVAFLGGREAPTIESARADFNQLGISFRGFHDWGVAKQEPRAGVKAAGA
jgi:phage major head subunit gpT-like protein